MRAPLLILMVAIFASCNSDDNKGIVEAVVKDTTVNETPRDNVAIHPKVDSIPYNIQVDTVINFAFAPDSSSLTTRGSINKKSEPVNCYLQLSTKKTIIATIIPDDNNLNIRFSNIIAPDGSSDGPFGRQLKYEAKQKGMYKLIIASNSMAEGKTRGDFSIRLELR